MVLSQAAERFPEMLPSSFTSSVNPPNIPPLPNKSGSSPRILQMLFLIPVLFFFSSGKGPKDRPTPSLCGKVKVNVGLFLTPPRQGRHGVSPLQIGFHPPFFPLTFSFLCSFCTPQPVWSVPHTKIGGIKFPETRFLLAFFTRNLFILFPPPPIPPFLV